MQVVFEILPPRGGQLILQVGQEELFATRFVAAFGVRGSH